MKVALWLSIQPPLLTSYVLNLAARFDPIGILTNASRESSVAPSVIDPYSPSEAYSIEDGSHGLFLH